MKQSYKEFELLVKHFSHSEDFKQNSDKLKNLRLSSYEVFAALLKRGGEITQSIKACDLIFNMSRVTPLTEMEIAELTGKFRFINAIIDETAFR